MTKKTNRKYASLRSALIERGQTLRRFAMERGIPLGTIYHAASGNRSGVKTTAIRRQLEEFINAQ